MSLLEIQVPDIGDFDEVAVIELLVKPGDTVKAEQSLITVESDKASMEIPATKSNKAPSCSRLKPRALHLSPQQPLHLLRPQFQSKNSQSPA
jgi:Biotin-requiring enzyme